MYIILYNIIQYNTNNILSLIVYIIYYIIINYIFCITYCFFHLKIFLNKPKYFLIKICCDKIRPLHSYRDSLQWLGMEYRECCFSQVSIFKFGNQSAECLPWVGSWSGWKTTHGISWNCDWLLVWLSNKNYLLHEKKKHWFSNKAFFTQFSSCIFVEM